MTSGVSLAAVLALGAMGDQGNEARAATLPVAAAVGAMNAAALEPAAAPAIVERPDSLGRTASAPEALGIADGRDVHASATPAMASWLPEQ